MVQKTQRGFTTAILASALIAVFGVYRFPGMLEDPDGRSGLLGFVLILAATGVTARFGPAFAHHRSPAILQIANLAGLLAGLIFVLEMAWRTLVWGIGVLTATWAPLASCRCW